MPRRFAFNVEPKREANVVFLLLTEKGLEVNMIIIILCKIIFNNY